MSKRHRCSHAGTEGCCEPHRQKRWRRYPRNLRLYAIRNSRRSKRSTSSQGSMDQRLPNKRRRVPIPTILKQMGVLTGTDRGCYPHTATASVMPVTTGLGWTAGGVLPTLRRGDEPRCIGTDSVRVVLVRADTGTQEARAVVAYPRWSEGRYCDPAANRFRQHPLDYTESLERACRQLSSALSAAQRDSIIGIGVDTTGSTVCAPTRRWPRRPTPGASTATGSPASWLGLITPLPRAGGDGRVRPLAGPLTPPRRAA